MTQEIIQGGGDVIPAAEITIRIARDYRPTFDDMVTLESLSETVDTGQKDEAGKAILRPVFKWREARDLFNRALVGGCGHLPVDDPALWAAIGNELQAYFKRRANPNS